MSGSLSIDPRQAGRFDISRFRESQPIYVTLAHHALGRDDRDLATRSLSKIDAEKPDFRRGA